MTSPPPQTPDGRYLVVRGRLWRLSNPALPAATRESLVAELMAARREVALQGRAGNADGLRDARARVDSAKRALGERGAVWWTDGAPDLNRKLVKNTPYASWFDGLSTS
ncbi:hypothetical protein EON62_01505 [archaeon]|nr:MAG: hypothetical protein EON62_01505 [archaeon]